MEELVSELQQRVREYQPDFSIYLGQETYYHDELTARLRQGKAYTMAGSRYVLVELIPEFPILCFIRASGSCQEPDMIRFLHI